MSHFNFEYPYVFLLLPLFWICQKKCPPKSEAIYFPYIHILIGGEKFKSLWLEVFKWFTFIMFLFALASPVKKTIYHDVKKNARDIMLILDISDSMKDIGFDLDHPKKRKIDAVKEVVNDFINKRVNDRIGLISFASSAFIASPLTFDKNYLKEILKKQQVGLLGSRTAIYDGLAQSLYLLESDKAKSKVAILLTDGSDNMSTIKFDKLLNFIKKSGIKVYVIGVGAKEDLNINRLKKIANVSHGEFFMVQDKNALFRVYNQIDASEYSKQKAQSFVVYKYYYYFPLIFALISLMLFIYFKSVKGVAK